MPRTTIPILDKIRRDPASILQLGEAETVAAVSQSFQYRIRRFGNTLHCHAPGFSQVQYEITNFAPAKKGVFESISITGTACALQCDHCRGYLLNIMRRATNATFERVLNDVIASGAKGILVSGGSDAEGKVPVIQNIDALRNAKKDHDIEIVVHSGYMEDDEIAAFKDARVDGIMFDFIGSGATARSVCHLNTQPADYARMVSTCKRLKIPVMPHVVIGLDWGAIKGEVEALSRLGKLQPDVLVLVILMPFPGTPMEKITPDLHTVEKIILLARVLNPAIPVQLGCARPHGDFKEQVERFAIRCGINGIAFPLEETTQHARELGLNIEFHDDCCSLICKHIRTV
nr:hypothetical protein [Candidatus Sigynarchaeota archaeon]